MTISLRQVRYFIAVAESGSVSSAAQQVTISQSTVTEAIKGLEASLGVELIERHGRGVTVTPSGQRFLRHARRILDSVAEAEQFVREEPRAVSGRLNIGVTPLVAGYYLADLVVHYRRAFPEVELRLIEDTRDYVEHLLVNGELDIGVILVSNLENAHALQSRVLKTSPYKVWLPAGHPLARREIITMGNVANERFIVLNVDELGERMEVHWRSAGIRPTIAMKTSPVEAVRSLVATGAGLAILPDLTYRPWSLEGDRVEVRPIADDLPIIEIGIAWRHGSSVPETAQNFMDLAAGHVAGRGFSIR